MSDLEKFKSILSQTSLATRKIEDSDARLERKENYTRHKLAMIFTAGFFIVLVVVWLSAMAYNALLLKYVCSAIACDEQFVHPTDAVTLIAGTVGPSLGFVVGYYFKEKFN